MKLPIFSIGHVNSELFSLAGGIWNHEDSATGDGQGPSEVQSWMLNYVNALCINSWQVHVSSSLYFCWHVGLALFIFLRWFLGFLSPGLTSLIRSLLVFILHHMIIHYASHGSQAVGHQCDLSIQVFDCDLSIHITFLSLRKIVFISEGLRWSLCTTLVWKIILESVWMTAVMLGDTSDRS